MPILWMLIPLSLLLVACACWAFFWAVDAGQFDDLDSPGWDALHDEEEWPNNSTRGASEP